jgi:hypothetical protein
MIIFRLAVLILASLDRKVRPIYAVDRWNPGSVKLETA